MSNKKRLETLFLLLILILYSSTAWAGTDSTEKDTGGITVWQTFFMLLTVIPVSKMLSSIFMKLVARVGTVDEDKWAMIGLGAIGATVGLMRSGGGGMPGMRNTPTPGAVSINGSGGSNPGQMSVNSQTPVTGPPGSPQTSMNSISPSFSPGEIPEVGQRNLNDILNLSGSVGSKSAGVAAKVGAASAFAVPGVAPVTAGIYAATTKGAVGAGSSMYNLARELKTRNQQNNRGLAHNLMAVTGTNSMVTATTKVTSALALSPLGSRVSNYGVSILDKSFQKTGNAVQNLRSRIYKP